VTPAEALAERTVLLAAVVEPAGFSPGGIEAGHGSGGDFARTCWTRGDQAIAISFRTSLGTVEYRWGDERYEHRHVVGALGVTASYPGFSADPLDGFRHLAADLEGPLSPVLRKDTNEALTRVRGWRPVRNLP
jgi:hypothetical protein